MFDYQVIAYVIAVTFVNKPIRKKYREMILDGSQTVLGYFGFDRTIYGDKRNTTPRKWRWLQELRQQREKDIKTEML